LVLWFAEPSRATSQYRFYAWTADDGLPQNVPQYSAGRRRYLLLATLDGLARFDGVR